MLLKRLNGTVFGNAAFYRRHKYVPKFNYSLIIALQKSFILKQIINHNAFLFKQ